MSQRKVMVVFGTRPEAIKMAPVIVALRSEDVETCVVSTGQHREMLRQVLDLFGIIPDHDLDLMQTSQDLDSLFGRISVEVGRVIRSERPDLVVVHGDTTTTLAAGLASFHNQVPLAHVEAGLRSRNIHAPWPEEANRRLVAPLARLHFAPTEQAKANLVSEGVGESSIHVTGNTVVDALRWAAGHIGSDASLRSALQARFWWLDEQKHLILVTGHRRESFGSGFQEICRALLQLAERSDTQIVYPLHLNPNVRGPVERALANHPNIFLTEPLEYPAFVYLMTRADVILTDSGGIQEEAPSLGKPVLVLRDVTERPEAVECGVAQLVGTSATRIVEAAEEHLDASRNSTPHVAGHSPFGDGSSALRIARVIAAFLTT